MIHVEDLLNAALASLRETLPDRIAAMNAATATDGYDVVLGVPDDEPDDEPGSSRVSYSTGADPVLRYPWVEVAVPDSTHEEWSVGQVDGIMRAAIVVRMWVSEPRPPLARADRAVKRMAACVLETLVQPGAFGGGAWVETIRAAYRVDPLVDEGTGPVAAAILVFTVGVDAVRP